MTSESQMEQVPELAALIASIATEANRVHHVPGVAVGVMSGDEQLVVCEGVTNVEHPLPVDASTLFQAGSISKTITSAAVMLLVQDGRPSLDDTVADLLPEFVAPRLDVGSMTVEHLLSHRTGFDGDHLFVHGAEHLSSLADARRLFDPGEGVSYSNAGFTLAGAVVEAVTDQSYDDFVRERLFAPLGMSTATFRADDAITRRIAAPHLVVDAEAYVLRGAGWQPGWELATLDHPAAGLVASVQDLLRWAKFQLDGVAAGGTTLLDRTSLERLHTPVVRSDALDSIALDWFVREIDGVSTIGHAGVTVGYISDLLVAPTERTAVVILTNATNGAGLIHDVRTQVLQLLLGVHDAPPSLPERPVEVPEFAAGTYAHSFADLAVSVGAEPGTVVVAEHRRSDVHHGWLPPTSEPVVAEFFAPLEALVRSDGEPRIVRFGTDSVHGPWVQWRGRRALRR